MSTSLDFVEYICEQIAGVGQIRYRKMFGEYMVYVNNKPILTLPQFNRLRKLVFSHSCVKLQIV